MAVVVWGGGDRMHRSRDLWRRATMASLPSRRLLRGANAVDATPVCLSPAVTYVALPTCNEEGQMRDRNGRLHVCASRHGYEAIERVDLLTLFLFSSLQRSQPGSSSAPYALPLVGFVLEAAADSATGLLRSIPCSYRSQIIDGGGIVASETGCSLSINRPPNPKHWAEVMWFILQRAETCDY